MKKFVHFNLLSTFKTKKISASADNTTYTLGGEGTVYTGTPDIKYSQIVFIKDVQYIYTHGKIYKYATTDDLSSKLDKVGTANTGPGFAVGTDCSTSYETAIAHGGKCTASGRYSHAEGYQTTASGNYSHAEGGYTTTSGNLSHAEGFRTIANTYVQKSMGRFNVVPTGSTSWSITAKIIIIGNGDSDTARSNSFSIANNGNVYAAAAYNTGGADYAEYFEWEDGNVNGEDRIGHFVALTDNGKIKIANCGDDVIGVISGISSIIGNANEDTWEKMYLRDVFGRVILEDKELEYETGEFNTDEDGNEVPVTEMRMSRVQKLNPEYDPDKKYIPRSQRNEWDVVGLLGQVIVIDDGSCKVGKKASVAESGIATNGSDYRVIKRIDDSHVVLLANFL